MREILFRGKRVDNGEWVEGYYAKAKDYLSKKEMHVIFPLDLTLFPRSEFSSYEEIDPETVGQYTGLKDKNGKKIFEGDIVSINGNDVLLFIDFTDLKNETEYMSLSFNCRRAGHPLFLHRLENKSTKYEAVGNIHDNPELLEEKK